MSELKHLWFSQQGGDRTSLSDYCAIRKFSDASVYVLTDGATSGPGGNSLAKNLAEGIIDETARTKTTSGEIDIIAILGSVHTSLQEEYRNDISSYLVLVCFSRQPLKIYYAGDCRLGVIERPFNLRWLTSPHCLANAIKAISEEELQQSTLRHTLTRSFNYKRVGPPEFLEYSPNQDECLILATDGLWGELNTEQVQQLIESESQTSISPLDDCSFLVLHPNLDLSEFDKSNLIVCSDNIYI